MVEITNTNSWHAFKYFFSLSAIYNSVLKINFVMMSVIKTLYLLNFILKYI